MSRSRKATLQRLLSLTSLGAAALVVGAGDARATVFWSGPITTGNNVGFGSGGASSATVLSSGLGPAKLRFVLSRSSTSGSHLVRIAGKYLGGNTLFFGGASGFLNGFKKGSTLQGSRIRGGMVARRSQFTSRTTNSSGFVSTNTVKSHVNNFKSGNSYALFSFKAGSVIDQGWAKLNVSVSNNSGPLVTLESYAYDDTGRALAAGDISAPVPEPSGDGVELTALAVLVMGGSAVRRWRTFRRAAAAA